MADGFINIYVSAAFSPAGKHVLINGGTVFLWSAVNGEVVRTYPELKGYLAFSPDGNLILSGGSDFKVKLSDSETGSLLRTFEGHTGAVTSVAFSADGHRVLSGSADGTIKLWDAQSGRLFVTFFAYQKEWLAMTSDGFFSASPNGSQGLSVVRGLEAYSVDQMYQSLYSPDLVRKSPAGDPDGEERKAADALGLEKVLDSGKAPEVVVTSPKANTALKDDVITAEANVADRGGGIGRIEWRVEWSHPRVW